MDSKDPKNEAIKHYLLAVNAQAIGLTECNVHWKKIPAFARLQERTTGWFEALGINTAYYEKYEVGSRRSVLMEHRSRRAPDAVHWPGSKRTWSVGMDAVQGKTRHSSASSFCVSTGTQSLRSNVSLEPTQDVLRSEG